MSEREAADRKRHDLLTERATNSGTDGSVYSIDPQAMTHGEYNENSVKSRRLANRIWHCYAIYDPWCCEYIHGTDAAR